MIYDLIRKAVYVEEDDESDYRNIGAAWYDETGPGLFKRIALSFSGWRDGRRRLVNLDNGVARSPRLDMLHAEALAEVVSLAQLRHAQMSEAQDGIDRLAFSIPDDEARLEKLERECDLQRSADETVEKTDGAASEDGSASEDSGAAVCEELRRDKEINRLRQRIRSRREKLISLRAQKAFLREDADLKLVLLIKRYHERAARYLRAADGCGCRESLAGAEPPDIEQEAKAILARALTARRFEADRCETSDTDGESAGDLAAASTGEAEDLTAGNGDRKAREPEADRCESPAPDALPEDEKKDDLR